MTNTWAARPNAPIPHEASHTAGIKRSSAKRGIVKRGSFVRNSVMANQPPATIAPHKPGSHKAEREITNTNPHAIPKSRLHRRDSKPRVRISKTHATAVQAESQ